MTTQLLERPDVDEAIDLSDLDLLDGHEHYACMVCIPGEVPIGIPFTAWCGQRAIRFKPLPPGVGLPDPCEACITGPCAQCGTGP